MLPQRVESRRRLDDSLQLKGSTCDFYCGSLTKRRDTIHVIRDILSLGKDVVSITQVIQKANCRQSGSRSKLPGRSNKRFRQLHRTKENSVVCPSRLM